ncbi:MAG: bifunctional diaminohydroxyphosphoribosylaminopyrimidine deaminase/5-amino-6-(5-phosphoribosylamino)uracil reductase RibD [Mobilicoccus sp.]|nr:bifunctional diaminohydroxyphosphoribosylaminopyrimidine deaminase/5-amino-6-(5-phosphoribosylamino)uracil reductase RibD [Mobilicoccus sp.]
MGSTGEQHMRRALDLAALGPHVDPNPRVGAVVTDQAGRVVGEGHHRGSGTSHAEVEALTAAGDRARGGTCHVTLEPCGHVGRTPACAGALIEAGVARVVIAARDDNPVAAGGAERLRAAGIDVVTGVLAEQALALNRAWHHAMRHGRPLVTWKCAATLDGRVAAADGTSRWITGAVARRDVHELRARVGAIVVGTGTVFADDPALTVRLPETPDHRLLRVVVGERAEQVSATARVRDDAAPTLLLPTRDPALVLDELHARGIRHVLLEGGPRLAAAFWAADLVDDVVAYLAPALLGAGPSTIGDLGVDTIADIRRLHVHDVALVGDDVRIRATRGGAPKEKP